jgi:hypothetical protein
MVKCCRAQSARRVSVVECVASSARPWRRVTATGIGGRWAPALSGIACDGGAGQQWAVLRRRQRGEWAEGKPRNAHAGTTRTAASRSQREPKWHWASPRGACTRERETIRSDRAAAGSELDGPDGNALQVAPDAEDMGGGRGKA